MQRIFLFLLIFNTLYSSGQEKYELIFSNQSHKQFIKRPKTTFKDSASVVSFVRELKYTAIRKGYILASIDTLEFDSARTIITFKITVWNSISILIK